MGELRVLFLGEIVGKAGVYCVKMLLRQLKEVRGIDFVIANGDGATGGYGIGKNHSAYLHKLGVDVITSGECIYYKKDMVDHIARSPYILRPANYPVGNPGYGWRVYDVGNRSIGIINLLGLAGFENTHLENPFLLVNRILERMTEATQTIVVDFHAVATAEKQVMFHHVSGRVTAVVGTHTKAMTADERVLPSGTACITDVGRTGSFQSVGGLDPDVEIRKYLTQIREYSRDAWDALELQGVEVLIDEHGTARAIERIRVPFTGERENDREGTRNESTGNVGHDQV